MINLFLNPCADLDVGVPCDENQTVVIFHFRIRIDLIQSGEGTLMCAEATPVEAEGRSTKYII